ncbi:MAG: hypothetical protein MSS60_02740 [Clostridiales bacterium]|nr:hypothetical protein [Clostridiales bacterium]
MVEHEFYLFKYHGVSISSPDEWYTYESRAAAQLARYKRIYTVSAPGENAESMAICAMADAFYAFDSVANGGNVQSASIGSVSASYGSTPSIDVSPKGQAKELYRCACLYLDIYRG